MVAGDMQLAQRENTSAGRALPHFFKAA